MNFKIFQKFKLAVNGKASIMFDDNKTLFFVDKKINGCDCKKASIKIDLANKNVLVDLDDTILHNDFAEEIFPEYLDGSDPYKVKLNVLKEHYLRLSTFSPEAFDWEYLSFKALNSNKLPDLHILQEKYYVWPFVFKIRGADKMLKNLKNLGCKIYAYTNGYSKYQRELLKKLNIEEFFEDILSPDVMGVSKVDFFKKTTLKKEDTIVIGDDYFYDVEVPAYHGFMTAWIYKYKKGPIGTPSAFPDYAFFDLSSLIKALTHEQKD